MILKSGYPFVVSQLTFKTRDRFRKIMSSSLVGRVLLGLSLQALCGGPYKEPCAIVCHCQWLQVSWAICSAAQGAQPPQAPSQIGAVSIRTLMCKAMACCAAATVKPGSLADSVVHCWAGAAVAACAWESRPQRGCPGAEQCVLLWAERQQVHSGSGVHWSESQALPLSFRRWIHVWLKLRKKNFFPLFLPVLWPLSPGLWYHSAVAWVFVSWGNGCRVWFSGLCWKGAEECSVFELRSSVLCVRLFPRPSPACQKAVHLRTELPSGLEGAGGIACRTWQVQSPVSVRVGWSSWPWGIPLLESYSRTEITILRGYLSLLLFYSKSCLKTSLVQIYRRSSGSLYILYAV